MPTELPLLSKTNRLRRHCYCTSWLTMTPMSLIQILTCQHSLLGALSPCQYDIVIVRTGAARVAGTAALRENHRRPERSHARPAPSHNQCNGIAIVVVP